MEFENKCKKNKNNDLRKLPAEYSLSSRYQISKNETQIYNSINSICQSTSFCRDLLNDTVENRKDDKTVHCVLLVVDWFSHCILSQKLKEIDLKEKISKTLTE